MHQDKGEQTDNADIAGPVQHEEQQRHRGHRDEVKIDKEFPGDSIDDHTGEEPQSDERYGRNGADDRHRRLRAGDFECCKLK